MSIEAEFNYVMALCKADLAKGKQINYTCPFCGMPLAGLFELRDYSRDDDNDRDDDDGDEKIYCPCCGQDGAF